MPIPLKSSDPYMIDGLLDLTWVGAMIAALSVATPDAQLIRLPHRIAAAHQVALSDGHTPTHSSARDPPSAV